MNARGDRDRTVRITRATLVAALAVTMLGLIGFAVGLMLDPARTLHAYLAAFAWAFSIAFGALFMVMIAHVTGARWFVVVRRLAERIASTLPAFIVLFLPIAIGVATLYPWVPPLDGLTPELVENIRRKGAWLNVPFWLVRAAVCFLLLSFFAWRLQRWSLRQDELAEPDRRPEALAGIGIFVLGFVVTVASWDWLMSLRPDWTSTVFGAYWWAGGFLSGLCVMVLAARRLERGGVLEDAIAAGHYYALGRLMLTFTVFWAYMAFSQGFLIWIADLPREVTWYLARTEHGWGIVFWILILGHFVLPFLALLSKRTKTDGGRLVWVAGWLLVMHYVDMFWLVLPALTDASPAWHWQDVTGLALVGGAATSFGLLRSAGRAALPVNDPHLAESMQYRRSA